MSTTEERLASLEHELTLARSGSKLPMTGGGWHPTAAEPKYLPKTHYVVNLEAWGRNKRLAAEHGEDPNLVPPVVVEIDTTLALQQCRAAKWELFQNGNSLGMENLFRDATRAEVEAYKIRKAEAIEKRNAEVDAAAMRNAPRVVVQNIGQPIEAAPKKGK